MSGEFKRRRKSHGAARKITVVHRKWTRGAPFVIASLSLGRSLIRVAIAKQLPRGFEFSARRVFL